MCKRDSFVNARDDSQEMREEIERLEQQHAEGCKRQPVTEGDSDFYAEQDLGDL